MISSWPLIGPILASSSRANCRASGVRRTSGGKTRCNNQGEITKATDVGTTAASSQEPNVSFTSAICNAKAAPVGLALMAVSHRPEDNERLTMLPIIRNAPRRLRVASSGSEPLLSAIALTMGNRTPDRAVLLGKAGAIKTSVSVNE